MVGSQKMLSIPVTMLLKKVCANFGGVWVQHHEMAALEWSLDETTVFRLQKSWFDLIIEL